MNILWCTRDTAHQAAQWTSDFQDAVSKLANVIFVKADIGDDPAWVYRRNELLYGKTRKPVIEKYLEKYDIDFIFVEFLFVFTNEPWKSIKIPKGLFVDDLHPSKHFGFPNVPVFMKRFATRDWMFTAFDVFNFDILFHTYRHAFKTYRKEFYDNHNCFWLPFPTDTTKFCPKADKEVKVLLTGKADKGYYPIRYHTITQLKDKPYFLNIPRPIERKTGERWPIGEDYIKLLSSAEISIACGTVYKYPLIKYFEIPATGCLLLADYNYDLPYLGFVPDKNMVSLNVRKVDSQIQDILQQTDKLREMQAAGRELIDKYHSTDIRAKQFLNCIARHVGQKEPFNIKHDFLVDFSEATPSDQIYSH